MMPLRKMRSRSLAVVELVLSLRVSSAWCMAAERHTEEGGKKSLFLTGRRELGRGDRFAEVDTAEIVSGEEAARREPPHIFLPQPEIHLRHSASSLSVWHKWQYLLTISTDFLLSLLSTCSKAHAHTNTPLVSLSLSETRPCSPDHKGFCWMSGALVLNSTLLQADKRGPAYLLFEVPPLWTLCFLLI